MDIRTRAGNPFNFDVKVSGEPTPTTKWFLNKTEVRSSGETKVYHHDYNTKLNVRCASRAQTGTWTVTAENENGKDSVDIEIVVLDVPAPPRGPLEASDIHAKGATLSWKAPEETGGSPVERYVVEKMDEATGRWVPAGETDGPETSLAVEGLTPGHKYKFRVRAVNRQGKSEPLNMAQGIEAKNPFNEPDRPGRPEVSDFDKDFVELVWTPPPKDGGSEIIGYVIEKKDKFSPDWEKCGETQGEDCKGRVDNLIEGTKYEFRVRAINKGGISEPSLPTEPHIARAKNQAPKIDRNYLLDIKIRAGQTFEFNVPVSGEPPATKEWTFKNNMLLKTDRISVRYEDYKAFFRVMDSKRSDTGVYTLTAKNRNGFDEATVKISVADVPAPPEGPIRHDNVTRSGITVSWRPPRDDGGSEILSYIVEKLDTDALRWVPVGESVTTSLRADNLIEGHSYQFRVKAVNKFGESQPLATQTPITAKDQYAKPDKPGRPEVVDWDKDHVDLKWTPPRKDGGSEIEKYIIEKRPKFGNWEKGAEISAFQPEGRCKGLTEGVEYEFRIIAVNKGGPSDPSEPSQPVVAKSRYIPPHFNKNALQDQVVHAGKRIYFCVPIEASPKPTFEWKRDGKLLLASDRIHTQLFCGEITFEIPYSQRTDAGLYTLTVKNELGEYSASANVQVLDKPSKPRPELQVSGVTKDGCHLQWNAPSDDGGTPILHYVIEKMDTQRGTWSDAGMSTTLVHEVTRLIHMKQYHFRVVAVNVVGESEALETSKPTTAKNEVDEPSAPGKPAVTDWGKNHADLEWTPPKNTGGAPIEEYIVQRKEKGSPYWVNALHVPAKKTKATVPELTEGNEYEFRIIAVNSAGESEPSLPSDMIMARDRYVAPKIKTPLHDIRIKAGLIFHVDVDFIGEPAPTVQWTVNSKELKTGERSTVTAIGHHTVIHTVNCNRSDSGSYRLFLQNDSGIDEGTFEVTVLDRPDKPEGPLNYEEITNNSVTLSWKPPLDNGGSEITGYAIEKRDLTHGGGWVPAVAYVNPKYTHAVVPKLIEGTQYEFRVMAENLQGRSDPLDCGRPVVAKNQYTAPGQPGKPELVDSDKDHITIKYTQPISNGGSPIQGYNIERCDKATGRWIQLNKGPVPGLQYTDDRVTDGHTYEYRVSAVNAAGPGKPSDSSNWLTAKPMREAPKLHLDHIVGKKVRVRAGEPININIPLSGAPIPEIKWFKDDIKIPESNRMSTDSNGERTILHVDKSTRKDAGKFTITAENEFGKDSADIEVIVVDRPGPPCGPFLYPEVTQDYITLEWNPSLDDGGSPITGYVVEMQEFGSEVWHPQPGYCPKTTYTCKNVSEGHKYTFRVKAENLFGVSDPLDGKPIIAKSPFDPPGPPGQPSIVSYTPTQCTIEWKQPQYSGGKPITGYLVEKRERGGEWLKVHNYPTPNTQYTVQDLHDGNKYEFRVRAVNDAGTGEPSKASETITAGIQRTRPDPPEPPKADRVTKDSVTLSWRPPRNDGKSKILGYHVQYKQKDEPNWKNANDQDGDPIPDNRFTVPNLKEGDEYQFRVIAVNDVGPSDPSRPSANIIIEEQPNKPVMDLGAVRDIVVRAGEDFSIFVPYVGFPQPTATWFANDTVIDDTDKRMHIQLTPDSASIVVKCSQRLDAGQYRLQLRNNSGFDTATINVKVLDRPLPPENLRADEFGGDSLTLFWNPPKDDGGAQVTNYIIEKREARSQTWSKVSSYTTTTFVRVRNLVVGKDYEFRVMAENKYGASDPAETDKPIKARHPFNPPGPPGTPRMFETSEDSITIQWTKPRNDGGSPITHYNIEKKLSSDNTWTKATHAAVTDLIYKVPGLIENKEYSFRVQAVNAAGAGPWSTESDLIMARARAERPKITSDLSIRDLIVRAGEEFKISVPYTANPRPTVAWTINSSDVLQDDRIKFKTSDIETVFINEKSKRADSGMYTVVLFNSEGTDKGTCRVQVVDRPLPPTGPIEVTDITPDSCTVSWKPPNDDGGSPITNYIVERYEPMGYWTKCSSFVRSCHYDSIGLEHKKKYTFRIRAENQYGVSDPLLMDDGFIASYPFTVPDPPGPPRVIDWDSVCATITWDRPLHDGGSRIQGYKVEFRDCADDPSWRINDFLVKDNTYQVYNLLPGHEYEFRVRAQNAAGLSKPSSNSSKFKMKSKFTVPSRPGAPAVIKVGKNYVDLKWTPPETDGGSKITGYIIERRDMGGALWVKCNDYNVLDTEYTVTNLVEMGDYEFRIIAQNAAGKSEPSECTPLTKVCEVLGGVKPDWVRRLQNNLVPISRYITLECEAHGTPEPMGRWLRNGKEIHTGGRFKAESINGVFKLTINDARYSDEGDYTCEAINSLGFVHTSGYLKVGVPPKIINMPEEVFLVERESGKIKIYYSGDQPMTVKLTKDGRNLEESEHIRYTIFDEYITINIRDVVKDDGGAYVVSLQNDSGAVSGKITAFITGLPGPPTGPIIVSGVDKHICTVAWKPPSYDGGSRVTHYVVDRRDTDSPFFVTIHSFVKECSCICQGLQEGQSYVFRIMAVNENGMGPALDMVDDIKAKAKFDPPGPPGIPSVLEVGGDFAHLEWTKPEHDGGTKIQGYWIDKREEGMEAWQRVNVAICVANQINCSNLIEGRQYSFRIFAQNMAGIGPASEASGSVKIVDPHVPTPPEIIKDLNSVSVIQGKNAEFQCKITGTPKPKITWYKGARELANGSRHQIYSDGDSHHLLVMDVFGEDADEYVCRAVNTGGVKSTKASLSIKTPPKLNVPPRFRDTAYFDKGENVVIKIPFTGYPKPRMHWQKEGFEIDSGGHYKVETHERHAILTILDGSQMDSGSYRLTAENELGTDTALISIQISDRPDPPQFPLVENIGTDSLSLSWKAPSWDGGSSITNYLVEKREHPNQTWIRVGTTRFTLMPIHNLVPGHQFEFRVYAENVYGRSDASITSTLVTMRDAPKKQIKKKTYEVDETGKKIRGKADGPIKDYDQYVFDIYSKFVPQPVEVSTDSVYDKYDILEEIGTGAFGVVHRCRERATGLIFAAKFIPCSTATEKDLIKREIDVMNQLHHRKLINLHDAYEDDDEMVLILEFLSGGELFERITDERYVMSEAEVINYMRQICEGVKHMHERNIIHLDLKPENVMCERKTTTNVKLIDFGLATKLDPNDVVKVTTGTAEFAAPEIVEREPVGFYTDMWALGVLSYVLLSGLSPFAGDNDVDTLKNVKACDWTFDEEAFRDISEDGKDFIRRLLVKNKEKRMTAHECLLHSWLTGDHSSLTNEIARARFIKIRDQIRKKYENWGKSILPLGHLSEYSSLRKLLIAKYKILDTTFDRRQAAPRFVIKPQSTMCYEGQSVKFYCRVIGVATPTLSWYHNNVELKQSVKFMKRYVGDDYYFIINRTKLDDRGEYIIRAENHYGSREEVVFLNIHQMPKATPVYKPDVQPVRRREPLRQPLWQEETECAPSFTFLLRPRVMQARDTCKLLCCVSGKPMPTIEWFKNSRKLTKHEYSMMHSDGVVAMEILDCRPEDSGKYRCVAKNPHGTDETSCVVIVEGKSDFSPFFNNKQNI